MVRIKNRYLLLHILYPTVPSSLLSSHHPSPSTLTAPLLLRHIRDQIALLFGDYGTGVVGGSLALKYFSAATSTAILRVARQHYRVVWAAVCWISRLPKAVGEGECVVRVVRVSGSVRACEEECVRRAKGDILRVRRVREAESAWREGGKGGGAAAAAVVGVREGGEKGVEEGRGEEDAGVKVARDGEDELMDSDGGEMDRGIEDDEEHEEG